MIVPGSVVFESTGNEELSTWLERTPPKTNFFAPGECEFLNPGDGSVDFLAIPEPGLKDYRKSDYTTNRYGSVPGVKFTVGEVVLTSVRNGLVLSSAFAPAATAVSTATVGRWSVTADSMEALMRHILTHTSEVVMVDVLSCWQTVLGILFEYLGPRRSVALLWKLYSNSTSMGTYTTSQIGETEAFAIIAGVLPGLFRRVGGASTAGATAMSGGAAVEAIAVAETYMAVHGPELRMILTWLLCQNGWLPGPSATGTDSTRCSGSTLGSFVRRCSNLVVGHRRWIAIEPLDAGDVNPTTAASCGLSLAKMRGINATAQSVVLVGRRRNEELMNFISDTVLLGSGPLVLVVNHTYVDSEHYPTFRTHLFPYASAILCIGSGMSNLIDTRLANTGRLAEFRGWPPYVVEYFRDQMDLSIYRSTFVTILTPSDQVDKIVTFWNAISLNNPPIGGGGAGGRTVLVVASNLPEQILGGVNLHPDVLNIIERSRTVFVHGTTSWRPALANLMHLQKESFVLKIYS